MAAVTTEGTRLSSLPAPSGRAGLMGTLRSEWTKIRSVRSTYWTLLALLVISVGIGAAITGGVAAHWSQTSPADRATFDATATSLAGLYFLGELVIVVLGALTITSEYSTGMIRTSLTSMPRRGVMYLAKAAVMAVVILIMALVAAFAAFWLGQALLASTHHNATLSQPNVLRAVIGAALYVTLCGLLGVRHRIDDPAHGRGDHDHGGRAVRHPYPGQPAAEQLARGRGAVAAVVGR